MVTRFTWKGMVFLNFLPETERVIDFIRTSLVVLEHECPMAYTHLCDVMSGRMVELVIGDEVMALDFHAGQPVVYPTEATHHLTTRLLTDPRTILDLADARLTIIAAVLERRIDLFGGVGELSALYEAILTYIRGLIRCPSAPRLLDHFRVVHGTNEQGVQPGVASSLNTLQSH
jgi:hypothetical protein